MTLDSIPAHEPIALNVKLRGSGQIINLSRMPDEFIDVLHDVIAAIDDPYTKLATWAYMFVGLSIDEIRERFIISEGPRVKHVSREYIRQKIKAVYEQIYSVYIARYGSNTIATLYYNQYIHVQNSVFVPEAVKEKIKGEVIEDSSNIQEEPISIEDEAEIEPDDTEEEEII